MTVNQFALATGYCAGYIANLCRQGKIPARMVLGAYEISEKQVPFWQAKRNRKAHWGTVETSVTLYQRAVDRYNKSHGTDYSYGQAVALGVIK